MTQLEQSFHKVFEDTKDNSPSFWKEQRTSALETFQKQGIPTNKNEEWKYTLLKGISDKDYSNVASISLAEAKENKIANLEGIELYFVNGKLVNQTEEIAISPIVEDASILSKFTAQKPYTINEPFASANIASSDNGLIITLEESIDKPIICYFNSDATQDHSLSLPQIYVHAKSSVQASFIAIYQTEGANDSFTNNQLSFYVEKAARVSLSVIQHENPQASIVANTNVIQERDSYFSSTTISTQGKVIRISLAITSGGENTESHMFGLYMLDVKTHVDNHTVIDHTKPNCYSNELYKGVLDGESRGVFNGKVYVRQEAQKTNAFQSNKNILISDNAKINTKPQLEIWADDVKCSHGATTGQLDKEALFYLMARGIDKRRATLLLLEAFSGEVIAQLKNDALKDYVVHILSERLG